MKTPKTIKGYIKLLKKIEKISPQLLKGFEQLPVSEKEKIEILDAELSNLINEIN